MSGEASQKRGPLERALTKFPWSARWERHCWQSNPHVQRTCSRKLSGLRELGGGRVQWARREVGGYQDPDSEGARTSGLGAGAGHYRLQGEYRLSAAFLKLRGPGRPAPSGLQGALGGGDIGLLCLDGRQGAQRRTKGWKA